MTKTFWLVLWPVLIRIQPRMPLTVAPRSYTVYPFVVTLATATTSTSLPLNSHYLRSLPITNTPPIHPLNPKYIIKVPYCIGESSAESAYICSRIGFQNSCICICVHPYIVLLPLTNHSKASLLNRYCNHRSPVSTS